MPRHTLKRRNIKKKKSNRKTHTRKSKKESTRKYYVKGRTGKYYIKGGTGYQIRGITEKNTAVDIVRTLTDYDPDADNPTFYRFEFYVSTNYLNTVQTNQYMPVQNKAETSVYLSAIPLSGEDKIMQISSIYENKKISMNQDPVAETDFDNFSEKIFNILNVMDRANFSIYGDAILLCKDVTLTNFGAYVGDSNV
jgi:hypothetical protein